MPESVEMPAPVSTTIRCAAATNACGPGHQLLVGHVRTVPLSGSRLLGHTLQMTSPPEPSLNRGGV